jgi:hypothetical protein
MPIGIGIFQDKLSPTEIFSYIENCLLALLLAAHEQKVALIANDPERLMT